MHNVTITAHVSGTCPTCGIVNNAQVATSGPVGAQAIVSSNASCGACSSPVLLTGSATYSE